jgi:hypothetical protein
MQSVKELQTNLATYHEQLDQVRQLLDTEPGNAEYVEMAVGLKEGSTTQLHAREDTLIWSCSAR